MYFMIMVSILLYVFIYRHNTYNNCFKKTYKEEQHFDNGKNKISVIIPAKNEELNIGRLLNSINSKYIDEIIVVNDMSTDNTVEEVKKFPAVKLIEIKDKPKGCVGKNYALCKGVKEARNDHFLFLDADTYITNSEKFDKVIEKYFKEDKVFTVLPYHKTKEFYEKLSAIFGICISFCFTKVPYNTSLFGACILISKDNYYSIGGHEAIKDVVVDDVALGRMLKSKGIETFRILGKDFMNIRMYNNIYGLWEGWSKNVGSGIRFNGVVSTITVGTFVGSMFYFLVVSILKIKFNLKLGIYLYLFGTLMFYLFSKNIINVHIIDTIILFPCNLIFFTLVLLNSNYLTYIKKKVTWKGVEIDL